jgi:hypothetical protein
LETPRSEWRLSGKIIELNWLFRKQFLISIWWWIWTIFQCQQIKPGHIFRCPACHSHPGIVSMNSNPGKTPCDYLAPSAWALRHQESLAPEPKTLQV